MLKGDKKGQLFCATNLYFYYGYLHLNEVSEHKVFWILFKTCYLSFLLLPIYHHKRKGTSIENNCKVGEI